jgi:toxin ParE1/3/4
MGLADFPERGSPRNGLRPGLRITGFERRVMIAEPVIIDRVLYGGREPKTALEEDEA